jgi:hypothetical protein
MNESYQATYDAVRSRISSGNIGEAVREAASRGLDASHVIAMLHQEFSIAAYEMQRPSVLYRPTVAPDGSKWCALYGPDIMEGVCGFGDTPAEAMTDFDKNWLKQRTSAAICECPRCGQWIEPGTEPDGCRDQECPKQRMVL